jgi:hypothetical protein
MSYIFVNESGMMSSNITKQFKKAFAPINQDISNSKVPSLKKLKAETTSPEEQFDLESFHDEIEEQTTTGSVGGSYAPPMGFTPKKMSIFAPEGSKEHEEGKKILKQMEGPKTKVFTKKNIKEMFGGEEEIEEQTTTGGVGGSYVTTKVWAKNKENWRGNKKQYPGGKFVKAKEKCKTFPYCDEGPGAIELSNTPKDKIDNVFNENVKTSYDLTDDQMYRLRDSDYLKLMSIISSVKNLEQFKSVERLWELYQKKFEGYLNRYFNKRVEDFIKEKYDELTNTQKLDESTITDEEKEKDFNKVIKTLKSIKNEQEFNSGLNTLINVRIKHNDEFTKEQKDEFKEILLTKIREIKKHKKDVNENKSVHRKIS